MAEKKQSTKITRLTSSVTTQAIEIGIAVAGGIYLGNLWWALAVWPVVYGIGSVIFSQRLCWWCGGSKTRTDGRGNIRDKNCWRCGNEGKVRRVGARLLGLGSKSS